MFAVVPPAADPIEIPVALVTMLFPLIVIPELVLDTEIVPENVLLVI